MNLLVQKTLRPKNVGPNWVTIKFVVAKIFHYTKTGTHVEGTNVAGQKYLCPQESLFRLVKFDKNLTYKEYRPKDLHSSIM